MLRVSHARTYPVLLGVKSYGRSVRRRLERLRTAPPDRILRGCSADNDGGVLGVPKLRALYFQLRGLRGGAVEKLGAALRCPRARPSRSRQTPKPRSRRRCARGRTAAIRSSSTATGRRHRPAQFSVTRAPGAHGSRSPARPCRRSNPSISVISRHGRPNAAAVCAPIRASEFVGTDEKVPLASMCQRKRSGCSRDLQQYLGGVTSAAAPWAAASVASTGLEVQRAARRPAACRWAARPRPLPRCRMFRGCRRAKARVRRRDRGEFVDQRKLGRRSTGQRDDFFLGRRRQADIAGRSLRRCVVGNLFRRGRRGRLDQRDQADIGAAADACCSTMWPIRSGFDAAVLQRVVARVVEAGLGQGRENEQGVAASLAPTNMPRARTPRSADPCPPRGARQPLDQRHDAAVRSVATTRTPALPSSEKLSRAQARGHQAPSTAPKPRRPAAPAAWAPLGGSRASESHHLAVVRIGRS